MTENVQNTPNHQQHIRAIDGLRGVAILLVMMHHFAIFPPGWAGVDIFFVISGFLITRILLGSKDAPHYFAHFYVRRVLRIFPVYYISLAIFFLLIFPVAARYGWLPAVGFRDALWFGFHLSNWWIGSGHMPDSPLAHFWSLAIEEQFYFVWPFLVFAFSRNRLIKLTMAIAFSSFLCRAIAAAYHPATTGFMYFYTPFRVEALALGSLAAIISQDESMWARFASWRNFLFWTGFTIWLTTIFLGNNLVTCVVGLSGIAAVALTMLIEAANGHSPFDTSFLRHLGKYSYALYVFHYPVMLLAKHIFREQGSVWGPVLTALAGVPVSYLLARVSWVVIEQPFLKLKDRFPYGSVTNLVGAQSS